MNLSLPDRQDVEKVSWSLAGALDAILAKINALWNIQHKADGTHGAVTATSLSVPASSVDGSGSIRSDLVPSVNGTYSLGVQGTAPTNPYFAWKYLRLTTGMEWIGSATSLAGLRIPSWSTTMSGDNLTTNASASSSQKHTFNSLTGTMQLTIGGGATYGSGFATSGSSAGTLHVDSLGVTNLKFDGIANALSYYNSGTWTPAGNGITLSSPVGRYVRIGRLVFVTCSFTFPVTADAGRSQISGLPFTADSNLTYSGAMTIASTDAARMDTWAITGGSTLFEGITTANATIPNNAFSGKFFYFSGVYETSA